MQARVRVGAGKGRVRGCLCSLQLEPRAVERAREGGGREGGREVQRGEGSGEEGERKGRASKLSESLHQHWISGTLKRKNPSPLGC